MTLSCLQARASCGLMPPACADSLSDSPWLSRQVQRRDQFDRIVVETTGLANPAPIIQTFILDQDTSDKLKLDGVVTLVDAKHVEQHLDDKKAEGDVNEALEQIAYADRIILNKTDLVGVPEQNLESICPATGVSTAKQTRPADAPDGSARLLVLH